MCDPFVMTSITAVRIAVRPKGGLCSGARRVPPGPVQRGGDGGGAVIDCAGRHAVKGAGTPVV